MLHRLRKRAGARTEVTARTEAVVEVQDLTARRIAFPTEAMDPQAVAMDRPGEVMVRAEAAIVIPF
jgi:hypothetical protein